MNIVPGGLRSALLLLFLIFSPLRAGAQEPAHTLLGRLEGRWLMTGDVMSKPVVYAAEGTWVLGGGFLSFHMTDTSQASRYEANLFIGIDTAKREFVAHWLDVFGGAGARVAGAGAFHADTIEIIYPYAERRFRNRFWFGGPAGGGTLVIEMERNAGEWTHFASYAMTRRR